MRVWLLKVLFAWSQDSQKPQAAAQTHKHSGTKDSVYFILYQLLPIPSQLEETAANGDADAAEYGISLQVGYTGPPLPTVIHSTDIRTLFFSDTQIKAIIEKDAGKTKKSQWGVTEGERGRRDRLEGEKTESSG